ncbi:hypothetical protein D3C87_1450250 [compost metagenome]
MGVIRKVGGHPVQNDADTGGVAAVDEAGEGGGGTKARGRREHAQGLVPPRAAEGIFHDRHQLHMREPHGFCVGGQLVGELVPDAALGVGREP